MTSARNLDLIAKLLSESPRHRLLEVLIVLAAAFWLPQFWLIERILKLRGGDDESTKAEAKGSFCQRRFTSI